MSDYRTWGATRNCAGCRYWSEMIAKAEGLQVVAMCLAPSGPNRARYVGPRTTCDAWAAGDLGAIDEPGQDPNVYKEAS